MNFLKKSILRLHPEPSQTNYEPPVVDLGQPEVSTSFSLQSQAESLLFARLPFDIRLQIFCYVLGEGHSYIIFKARPVWDVKRTRLAHYHCPHGPFPIPCCSRSPCCIDCIEQHDLNCCQRKSAIGRTVVNGREKRFPRITGKHELGNASLAMLRTCRQAYSEARLLPYSHNRFRFPNLDTFVAFSKRIRPASLASLRYLQAEWDLYWPPLKDRSPNRDLQIFESGGMTYFRAVEIYAFQSDETWLAFWDLMSSRDRMPALQELRIHLEWPREESWREELLVGTFGEDKDMPMRLDARWLQPVLKVRGLKYFEMRIRESISPAGGRENGLDEISRIVCEPAARCAQET